MKPLSEAMEFVVYQMTKGAKLKSCDGVSGHFCYIATPQNSIKVRWPTLVALKDRELIEVDHTKWPSTTYRLTATAAAIAKRDGAETDAAAQE